MVRPGDRVAFRDDYGIGASLRWNATVVRVEGDIAFVRHPEKVRTMKFSPVPVKGLYKYDARRN